MSYLVQKFGGTSVGDLERIENVAGIIASEVRKNNKVIAIVSAMSGETNRLVEQVKKTSPFYDGREYDVIVSTGENITAGLLAIKLQDLGIPARSWMGWQIPIITTSMHSNARILEIKTENIERKFVEGMKVAIVSGFQGNSKENRISTLGRGGSDTTAVAISAAFKAKKCDIFFIKCNTNYMYVYIIKYLSNKNTLGGVCLFFWNVHTPHLKILYDVI